MYGDYFSRMAGAEKESSEQQQQSVQNGVLTPNMAQDASQSQPKAMPQGQPSSGPIAQGILQDADQTTGSTDDLMAQINQLQVEIPQLKADIQSGKLQAYEGIPLLKDKVDTLKQLQAQLNPPVALAGMASNLPQQYAEGGIIAFAGNNGSYVDDEEDDDEIGYGGMSKQEEALMARYLDQIQGQGEAMPEGIAALEPQKESTSVGFNPEKKGASEGIQYTSKKHKYEGDIREAARKAGIPEELFLHMIAKETGGLSNPESARSKAGALGIAQFMPATAKQYGIDPLDMSQALPAAAKMTKSLLKHYDGDQGLAAMAYNWGQGNVDKWLASGADPAKLPKETANYIRAAEGGLMKLAAGGVIAFDGGGGVDEQTKKDREDFMMGLKKLGASAADVVTLPIRGVMGAANTGIRGIRAAGLNVPYIPEEAFGGSSSSMTPYYDRLVRAPEQQAEQQTTAQPVSSIMGSKFQGDQFQLPEKPKTNTEIDNQLEEYQKDKNASDEEMSSLRDMLRERQTSAKNQKEIDAYMALLQAGLGMMGGTSPYALANIGKGASTGIEAALASRKNQISEENAILGGRLGLAKAELFEKSRQNALKRQIDLDRQNAMFKSLTLENQKRALNQKEAMNISKAEDELAKAGEFDKLEADYARMHGKNWKDDATHKANFEKEKRAKIRDKASGYSVDAQLGIPSFNDVK